MKPSIERLTIAEAAAALGLKTPSIHTHIRRGNLRAVMNERYGQLEIEVGEVERFQGERRTRGQQKGPRKRKRIVES